MSKKHILIIFIVSILSLTLYLGISLWRCMQTNRELAKNSPYIMSNEPINYFNLTGVDESRTTINDLNGDEQSLIFIFSRPCTPCNKNLIFWNKIAQIIGEKTNIYGIILNDLTEAYNFSQKAKLKFNVYVPDDLDKFKESWKIVSNQSKTILIRNKRPVSIILGHLNAEDTSLLIRKIREI